MTHIIRRSESDRTSILTRSFKTAAYILSLALAAMFLALCASARTVVDNMDTGEGWDNASVVSANIVEGKGAITCTSMDLLITSRSLSAPIDMSELSDGGELHVWIYIEDASKLTGDGQLELTSSGVCDIKETSWSLSREMFVNGWNELTLSIYNAAMDEADLSAVNFIRFYEFTTGQNSWIIDELAFGAHGDFKDGAQAKSTGAAEEGDEDEDAPIDNNMGGFVSKNNNTAAGNGPINKNMYYGIIVFSALNIGAVAIISRGGKKE